MAPELRTSLEAQRRSGAQWFYWVAGLSLINSVVALAGQEWRFILGLGITQLVQEMAQESGSAGTAAGVVGLVFIACFALLGHRAVDGRRWAFVVGMVVYGLDGVIFLLAQHWIGVGFHVFALVMIGKGYVAARQLEPHD
jgi:MFS family permease